MSDLKSLFKSFVYAFKGIGWMIGHERNFRIHISCLCYMFYYLLRYDFFVIDRTQLAILLLASGLVIGGELLNTGVEKADDAVSKEKKDSIRISKDAGAGAVLVFAIFAVLCGVAIMFQPEAFKQLFNHYVNEPVYILYFVLSIIMCTLFIFKFDFNKKDKGNDR